MLDLQVEKLDGIDEAFHSLYEKTESGYQLKVNGIEDTTGLKSALQKERDSNKDAKARLAQLEKDREDAEKKVLEEQGKYKELSDKERAEKLETQKKLDELIAKVNNGKRDVLVKDLALSMTTDKDEIDVISRFATDYIEIKDGEVSFNKSIEDVKSELSRFVKSKASGSGDGGNNGGGGNGKTVTREQFNAMNHKQRADFAKSGGRVTD